MYILINFHHVTACNAMHSIAKASINLSNA